MIVPDEFILVELISFLNENFVPDIELPNKGTTHYGPGGAAKPFKTIHQLRIKLTRYRTFSFYFLS